MGWQSVEHLWGMQHGAKYRLAKVERSEITAYITATGTLNPVIMVQVGTQVSGMIEKLLRILTRPWCLDSSWRS